ncbi:recombinase family protein [Brassicibacter mesophilus]|uniref:recombinase family protein n=1 Tax=Brassicibacter mesophilus TaxID=745119 RepID=UPI003D1C1E41
MKIAIYSRKSVYTGKGESIENQIEMCKNYISANITDSHVADIVIYEDEGYSGKNTERPHFQKMLRDIRKERFNYVICYKLDRISRSVSDFSALIEELNDHNIDFVCIKDQFDTTTPMGKAMMYIASVFAQLERETIAERVRDNMLMLSKTGRWLGGTTPTGFTSEKVQGLMTLDGKIKHSCKLKSNPDEIEIVKTMYDKYLEFNSVSAVSKYLIKNNVKSRNGKFYSLLGIKEILQNPVYCIADKDVRDYFISFDSDVCFEEHECSDKFGLLSYNKRDYTKKNVPRNSKDQWIISIGKHKGIVSGKTWVRIQEMLENNKPSPNRVKAHNDYSLLSGMIYCTQCGSKMFAKFRSNNADLFDYICNSKMRGGLDLCSCQNLNGQQTDDMVCEYLMDYTNENSNIYKLLEYLKRSFQNEIKSNPIQEIDTKIKKLNDQIDNLIKTLSYSDLDPSFIQRINEQVSKLDSEVKMLNEEKLNLQSSVSTLYDKSIQLDIISKALSSLKDNFKDLTIYEKRNLIRLLIQKIEWDGQDLHIFIYGE